MILASGRRVYSPSVKLALFIIDALVRSHRKAIDLDDLQIFGHFSAKIEGIGVVIQIVMLCQAKIEPALWNVSLKIVQMACQRKLPWTNACSCHSHHQWRMPRAQRQQRILQEDQEREFALELPHWPSTPPRPAA